MSRKVRSGLVELLYGKEVQNYMESYMEYAVEPRDYSIGGSDFVFFASTMTQKLSFPCK
jgi:hypothetical protein